MFRVILIITLLIPFTTILTFGQKSKYDRQSIKGENCYVWTFSTRAGEKTELTSNLTREFEGALIKSELLTVLNRIKFASVLEQRTAEKEYQKINDLPSSAISTFEIINAKLVVFGETYQEVESDLIRITIRIQNLNSEIKLEVFQDAYLSRMNSIIYREAVLGNLIDKIRFQITGKKPIRVFDKTKGIFHRNTYTRGITADYISTLGECDLGSGLRLTFQSKKRWGISIGAAEIYDDDYSEQLMIWAGYSHLISKNDENTFNLIATLGIGSTNEFNNTGPTYIDRDWAMGMIDLKIKYKIFTLMAGAAFPQIYLLQKPDNLPNENRKVVPVLGFGIHFPF